jgi:selenide,water dikinase
MGADPLFALNIVGFPSSRLPAEILEQILQGANHIAKEAGISIIGGHTIDDPEPKYGMAVTGKIHPGKILSNSKAEEGDAIILTKPIGTGILSTAVKRGLAEPETVQDLHKIMASLNKIAAEIMKDFPVHACTDVTGFGLTGHLFEVSKASQIPAELFLKEVPLINKTKEFAAANLIPGGTYNNLDFFSHHIIWDEGISELEKLILCDAQTSGGLLIILPEDQKNNLVKKLENKNIQAKFIGRFKEKGIPKIFVKNQ